MKKNQDQKINETKCEQPAETVVEKKSEKKSRSTGFNKTIIIGRLGQAPELKSSPDKVDFANFSMCNTSIVNGNESIQWHRIRAFGRQAQLCHKYLRKGDLCCVEGRIDIQTYEKDGVSVKTHAIIADRVVFLSSKRREQTPKSDENGGNVELNNAHDSA